MRLRWRGKVRLRTKVKANDLFVSISQFIVDFLYILNEGSNGI